MKNLEITVRGHMLELQRFRDKEGARLWFDTQEENHQALVNFVNDTGNAHESEYTNVQSVRLEC